MSDRAPRHALRALTAAAHRRIDSLYTGLDLTVSRNYGRFLTSHAAAFIPVEEALRAAGADSVVPGWSMHQRSASLCADLAALDLPVPKLLSSPQIDSIAALVGGLYVLEGSRLGGAMLLRSVAPGLPTAFLRASGAISWRDYSDLIDGRLTCITDIEEAAAAANSVFAVFERGALLQGRL